MIKMEFSTTQRGARVCEECMYAINIGRAGMGESFGGARVLRAGAVVEE